MPSRDLNLRPSVALITCQVQLANTSQKLKLLESGGPIYLTVLKPIVICLSLNELTRPSWLLGWG